MAIGDANQPSAPSNFQGQGASYDPMMDYLAQMRYGMPLSSPANAQGFEGFCALVTR